MTETLNLLIRQLAGYFDVSVKFLQEHFIEYVLEYGKYKLIDNIWTGFILCSVVTAIAISFFCFIFYMLVDDYYGYSRDEICFFDKHKKKIVIIIVSAFAFISLSPVVYHLTMYKVSPEMYSLKQIQQDFIKDKGE